MLSELVRIACASFGSRGDAEPFALVAAALGERGHTVELCLDRGHHERARTLPRVTRTELGPLSSAELAEIVREAYAGATPDERADRAFHALFVRRRAELEARIDELDRGGFDLLILSACLLFPLVLRRSPGAPIEYRPRWTTPTAAVLHLPSRERDFTEIAALPCLRLAALTRWLLPPLPPDVAAAWVSTGFWIDRTIKPLDARVDAFLRAGPPPVLLTMGSAVGFEPSIGARFVAAARRIGARAIVYRGWAGLDAGSGDDVLTIEEADYASLFPRCAAIVTHGGIGTLAQVIHAARPVVLLPMINDQWMSARRLLAHGSCVGTLDPFALDAGELEHLLRRAVTDPRVASAAESVAATVAADRGIERACDEVERYLAGIER